MAGREQDESAVEELSETADEAGTGSDVGGAEIPPDSAGYSAPPLDAPDPS